MPGLITALRQPESISIFTHPAIMQHIMPLLTTTTLTKLHLCGVKIHSASDVFLSRERQPELQDLSLSFKHASPRGFGLAALSSLMQLTGLRLHGWDCLCQRADLQALAAITCLQALSLRGKDAYDAIPVTAGGIASLHALSALTSLTVITPRGDADEFVCSLAQQPLPGLQELKLALYEPFRTVTDLCQYVAALPAMRRLAVNLHRYARAAIPTNWPADDGDSQDYPAHLAVASGIAAREGLVKATACAAVHLSMEEHGFD